MHNLPSNEYFLSVPANLVFDEILIQCLIFVSDLLSSEIKNTELFPVKPLLKGTSLQLCSLNFNQVIQQAHERSEVRPKENLLQTAFQKS